MLDFEVALRSSLDLIKSEKIKAAADYALFPAGKRIRPQLFFSLWSDTKRECPEQFYSIPVALELFHTASLIHDDLPGLDNDDERRGRASLHRAFSEAEAILTGDVLPLVAIEGVMLNESMPEATKVRSCKILLEAFRTVLEGQEIDINQSGSFEEIHAKKTASLFGATFQLAALAANTDFLDEFFTLGFIFGKSFQFLDDLIDVLGDENERGRKKSSDIRQNKNTIATTSKEYHPAWMRLNTLLLEALSDVEEKSKLDLTNTRRVMSLCLSRFKLVEVTF